MPKPFTKGNPGRPKGALNKATRDIKDFSRACLTDPAYVASLKRRLKRGTAPHMETLLHHYAYGKPKDVVAYETLPPIMVVDTLTADDIETERLERIQ